MSAQESILAGLEARSEGSPLAVEAFSSLLEIQPAFAMVAVAALRRGDAFWSDAEDRCRETLHLCDGSRERFRAAVSQWSAFAYEFLEKQRRYLETGRYAITEFDEVRRELYEDDERMSRFYLIALMYSFLFSSNYVGFFEFFRRAALPRARGARSVADVGCGHGVYLSQALLALPGATGLGIDISPGSLATASRLLSFRGLDPGRYRLALGDLQEGLDVPSGSQDFVTCFEVIEHLTRPAAALAELRRLLSPGGILCVSTAIRMESVDHIHLFQTPEEVRGLIGEAGMTVVEDEVIPLTNEDLDAPGVRERLVADPRAALGYVALAR